MILVLLALTAFGALALYVLYDLERIREEQSQDRHES